MEFASELNISLLPLIYDTHDFKGTLCSTCADQIQFDASASSTFIDGGKTSTITFATGVGVTPVIGDNTQLTLLSAFDTVVVGGLSSPNVSLFLITEQTPTFNVDTFSGIQGQANSAL